MNLIIQSNKLLCEICENESIGINFGVRTCMACKAFFRRNAVRLGTYEFSCSKDGHCLITRNQYPMCKCCRLAKCFRMGMQKELILTENEKEQRRILIEHNRKKRKLKDEISKKLMIIRPIAKQSSYLSINDNQILWNIFHIYENHCRNQKGTSPIVKISHKALHSFFNEYSSVHQSLIIFLKNIPQFNQITIKNRIHLLRNTFGFINIIHATAVRSEVPENLVKSLMNIYNSSITNQLFQCIERIQMFTYDMIILRLLLIIITFSIGNLRNGNHTDLDDICTNNLSIFTIQNLYVELLWKYILTKSSDEIHAIKFFNKLIQFLMYLLNVHIIVDGYINSLPNEIERMDELMQSMWPNPLKNTLF